MVFNNNRGLRLRGDIDDFDRFPCVAYKNDKTEGGGVFGRDIDEFKNCCRLKCFFQEI